jgi:hypothetical protein
MNKVWREVKSRLRSFGGLSMTIVVKENSERMSSPQERKYICVRVKTLGQVSNVCLWFCTRVERKPKIKQIMSYVWK